MPRPRSDMLVEALMGERQGPYAPHGQGYNIGAEFPGLAGMPVVQSPQDDSGRMLEFWPPGEEGTPSSPRPRGAPIGRGVTEMIGGRAAPLDVAGDIVSHEGRKNDPVLKAHYEQFASSLTPKQQGILQEQYAWAKQNEGERRPFEQWLEVAGLPAYFRGYTFKQWPEGSYDEMYTPAQRAKLDQVVQHLKKKKP